MTIKQTLAATLTGLCLLTTAGCSHDESMAPPGPGPTALPQSYRGDPVPAAGPINTESRFGGPKSSPLQAAPGN